MTSFDTLEFLKNKEKEEIENFGVGFFTSPLSDIEISKCRESAIKKFGLELNEDYIDILHATDGFSCNGFNLYGGRQKIKPYFLDGIIEANLEFWQEESLRKYFAYSEESTTRIVFNIENECFDIVDRISWDTIFSFDKFIDALNFNLEESCIF